ncbi:TANC1 [Symbiodinium necroappetens]|uniref:TANC1 protein n=1 Tax=Symbiodinium necroappetens TaxID=1628268 RepID=A0A812LM76_9DINO|nr:TANC1 [Symbiodinium necroappetens]
MAVKKKGAQTGKPSSAKQFFFVMLLLGAGFSAGLLFQGKARPPPGSGSEMIRRFSEEAAFRDERAALVARLQSAEQQEVLGRESSMGGGAGPEAPLPVVDRHDQLTPQQPQAAAGSTLTYSPTAVDGSATTTGNQDSVTREAHEAQGDVGDADSVATRPVQRRGRAFEINRGHVSQPPATALQRRLGCTNCCNDGHQNGPCFDVEACAAGVTGGKYAFVYAHVGVPGWPWLTFLDSMRAQALLLEETTGGIVDIVVMMPAKDVKELGCHQRALVHNYGIRIYEVPWTIPPNSWYPDYWWPGKADGWCGPQDLMRLHALGMDEYNAVVFYDQDVEFQGDMTAVLKCAAKGYFISASGGVGEPFNVGFFALRPDKRLLRAAEFFGANVTFTVATGWGRCGFLPSGNKFVGAECGQGFFHTLFYKKCKPVETSLVAAGLHDSAGKAYLHLESVMVDRCIWNYQNDGDCGGNPRFDCNAIRVHHKPTSKPENDRLCGKLKHHHGGWSGEPRSPFLPPPGPPSHLSRGRGASGDCVKECVDVGNNCICNNPTPPAHHIKVVTVSKTLVHCQTKVKSSSNDRFEVKVTGPSQLTVTRVDAPSCHGPPQESQALDRGSATHRIRRS